MTHRILIVDDQRDVSRLLRSALETIEHGLEVVEAPSGEEAILEAVRKKVDLLVSDFRLPGMTGVELTKKFRARNPNIKVILITGISDSRSLKEIEAAHPDAYFPKPVPMAEFLVAVETALGLARTVVIPAPEPEPEPEPEPVVPPVAEPNKLTRILMRLLEEMNAIAARLIHANGTVQAEAGILPDPNTAIALTEALIGMHHAGQKAASLLDRGVDPLHLFHGEKTDAIFLAIGSTHSILVAGPGIAEVDNLLKALVQLAEFEMDILDELERMGVVVEVEPETQGGTPAYMEPFTRPENLPIEFMQIFDQVGKKATDANSFWDDVVEKGTTYAEPDKLTFEQATKLGLTPGAEDAKKK